MLHARRREVSGETLLELSFAITLLSLFLGSLYGFAFHAVADNRRAARAVRQIQEASRALDAVKERVRCAARIGPPQQAGGLALEMPDGTAVEFRAENGILIESRSGKRTCVWAASVASLQSTIEADGRYVGIEVRMKSDGPTAPELVLAGGACPRGAWAR